mmetsp:Transcript_12132/g.37579  ORF Transcript_12132/g.37579 Transcript_12132/m.37579 type:complete len:93 (-) Transcript_12132:14-292(-)
MAEVMKLAPMKAPEGGLEDAPTDEGRGLRPQPRGRRDSFGTATSGTGSADEEDSSEDSESAPPAPAPQHKAKPLPPPELLARGFFARWPDRC